MPNGHGRDLRWMLDEEFQFVWNVEFTHSFETDQAFLRIFWRVKVRSEGVMFEKRSGAVGDSPKFY